MRRSCLIPGLLVNPITINLCQTIVTIASAGTEWNNTEDHQLHSPQEARVVVGRGNGASMASFYVLRSGELLGTPGQRLCFRPGFWCPAGYYLTTCRVVLFVLGNESIPISLKQLSSITNIERCMILGPFGLSTIHRGRRSLPNLVDLTQPEAQIERANQTWKVF